MSESEEHPLPPADDPELRAALKRVASDGSPAALRERIASVLASAPMNDASDIAGRITLLSPSNPHRSRVAWKWALAACLSLAVAGVAFYASRPSPPAESEWANGQQM